MTKPASMEGTREEGRGCKKSVKACRQCLLFCLLLHCQVNLCDGEVYLLAMSKVRKEILKRLVRVIGMGQVFSQRSLDWKSVIPSHRRQDKRRVELGLGFPALQMHSGKQLQHKEVAAQDASLTQTDLHLFIIIIYLYYCITLESQLDKNPTLSFSLKAYTLKELGL